VLTTVGMLDSEVIDFVVGCLGISDHLPFFQLIKQVRLSTGCVIVALYVLAVKTLCLLFRPTFDRVYTFVYTIYLVSHFVSSLISD
jgi:hypothetical protein